MNKLRILLWNDEQDKLDDWKKVATDDGFAPSANSDREPNAVVAHFERELFDLVVLDIVEQAGEKKRPPPEVPLGLRIAKAIRGKDPLVPIVAVTQYPDRVYDKHDDLDDYDLAGIYHYTIMRPFMFRDMVVQDSLNRWHVLYPDFAVVREAVFGVQAAFRDEAERDFADKMTNCLRRLPCSQSPEAWHSKLQEHIGNSLRDTELKGIERTYAEIAGAFETADRFYMAARLGRRHLSHNVQVFLLGTILLLAETEVQKCAIQSVRRILPDRTEKRALAEALLLWGCMSTTHDAAYLSQNMTAVTKELADLSGFFADAVQNASGQRVTPKQKWVWPPLHHAKVGAALWRLRGPDAGSPEGQIAAIVADAIENHDASQKDRATPKYGPTEWGRFLALMCDELQEWRRERPEVDIPWRIFALQLFRLTKDAAGVHVDMSFVAKDHPRFINAFAGTPGQDVIQKQFDRTGKTVEASLWYGTGWDLHLSAQVVSRGISPASTHIRLPRGP